MSKLGKVRKTAVPPDVAASEGYAISMVCRKRIEEIFGWSKTVGGLAQLKVRGLAKVQAVFTFGLVAYNLVRLPKLLEPTEETLHDVTDMALKRLSVRFRLAPPGSPRERRRGRNRPA